MTTTNNSLPVNKQPLGDICIPLFVPDDPEWLWYVIKCLSFPTAKRFWVKGEAVDIETVRREWEARVFLPFVNRAMEGITCPETSEGDCIEYSARAGFVTWQPINPFYDETIPEGYVQPPFFLWQNILPSIIPDFIEEHAVNALGFTGYEDNDVLTALWAFPFFMNWFNEFAGGFPRFTVKVQGQGSVELHLLNVPLGGRCLITVDIELNPLDIINGITSGGFNMIELNKDVFAAPPELETVHIVEIDLTDDIEHTIYVTFLPTVNDSLDFINFGGGLRKIVLCGVTPIEESGAMDCIDVLDCIDNGDNESIASYAVANQALAAGVWTPLELPFNDGHLPFGWLQGQFSTSNNDSRFHWNGDDPIKVHITGNAEMASATGHIKQVAIVVNGITVAISRSAVVGIAQLSVSSDIYLHSGAYFEIQVLSVTAGNTVASNVIPRMTAHRIDRTGATGAQGNAGIPGNEGAQGTVPPELEYLFFENIITNTNIFLDDLEDMYTDSPQDINMNIPVIAPDDTEDIALCKALSAWVFLYVEAKKARLRGASFLNQVWDAMTDTMRDAYTLISGVIGWNPLESLFGCFVDNETALNALLDTDAINQVICCLWGELMDIALLTTSLEGAINACEASLVGTAHDLICMLQSDLNLQHTLNFYYLYGKALEDAVITPCACGGYSYIEYDFTVSDNGFTVAGGTYIPGTGFEGTPFDPGSGNSRSDITITKEFAGALPKEVAAGYVIDTYSDCGITGQTIKFFFDEAEIQGMGIGSVGVGDNQHRTYANSTHVTEGKVVDKMTVRINAARCDGNDALARIKKVRIWLDQTSQLTGTPSENAPLGTPPDGTTDMMWWQ